MRLPRATSAPSTVAGLVHDVGLHGVTATVLDKSGPLSATEVERMRVAPYFTERVLARPGALARLGAVAGLAHERMDGSGYHRGFMARGSRCRLESWRPPARFRADRAPSPRPANTSRPRAEHPGRNAAGRLDSRPRTRSFSGKCRYRRRLAGPAGLTPREIEVLALIARGAANGESPAARDHTKTAGTHIERIYVKTGASVARTATLFALRNGLLGGLDDTGDSSSKVPDLEFLPRHLSGVRPTTWPSRHVTSPLNPTRWRPTNR